MRTLLLAILLFAPVSWAADNCTHDAKNFRCVKFIRNYDADTLTFDIDGVHPLIGKGISVRVRGVDAAEIKSPNTCEKEKARISRKLVEAEMKRAKKIDLLSVGKDKYFRLLADVSLDGRSLKDILIKNNLAYDYNGGRKSKINWCERLPSNLSK